MAAPQRVRADLRRAASAASDRPTTRLFKRDGKCFGIAEILHRELCIAHGFVVFTAAPRNLREQQFVAAALRWVGLRLLLACD